MPRHVYPINQWQVTYANNFWDKATGLELGLCFINEQGEHRHSFIQEKWLEIFYTYWFWGRGSFVLFSILHCINIFVLLPIDVGDTGYSGAILSKMYMGWVSFWYYGFPRIAVSMLWADIEAKVHPPTKRWLASWSSQHNCPNFRKGSSGLVRYIYFWL